jgi:hypothetical protein
VIYFKEFHIFPHGETSMTDEKKESFSEKIDSGNVQFAFEMKQTREGKRYLVISETRRLGPGYGPSRLIVYEENLKDFFNGIQKAARYLEEVSPAGSEATQVSS